MDRVWMKIARSDERERKSVEQIKPQNLTHVSCVKVCAPPDRKIDDPVCSIYGEVSFQVGGSSTSTTLFSRGKDNPDDIDLTGETTYLTFSDDESHRALPPVSPNNPLHVKMHLTENTYSEEDVLIADIDHWEAAGGQGLGECFVVEGLKGFKFEVCYSVVSGARVEVGALILKQGKLDNVMACKLLAYLCLNKDPPGDDLLPQTHSLLASVFSEEPLTVEAKKRIDLNRKFVVAPILPDQFLRLTVCTAMNDDDFATEMDVDFPLMTFWDNETQSLWANQEMTHMKILRLFSGTKLALSITFLRDVLEQDPQPRVKHDIESAPTSLERPCSMERECELDDDGGSSNLTPKVTLTPSKRPYSWEHEEHGDGGGLN